MTGDLGRTHCVTQRVKSPFGSLYAHVEFAVRPARPAFTPVAVWFSTPGKHGETDLDRVIRDLNLNGRLVDGRFVPPDGAGASAVSGVIEALVDAACGVITAMREAA